MKIFKTKNAKEKYLIIINQENYQLNEDDKVCIKEIKNLSDN